MGYLKIKSRLLYLSIIPTLFIVVLSSIILYDIYKDEKNLGLTKDRISEAVAISRVIHFIQIERGLTSGFIARGKLDDSDKKLAQAREDLDNSIENAKLTYLNITKNSNSYILDVLNGIKLRDKESLVNRPITDAINYYTKNISVLLSFIKIIPTLMDDKENRNFIQAYSYLAFAKEALGQTRASLMEVFTSGEFTDETFTSTKEQLKIYDQNMRNFKTVTPDKLLNYHSKNFNVDVSEETFSIIELALNSRKSGNFNINPDYWFDKATQTIDLLKDSEDKLFSCINRLINKKVDTLFYRAVAIVSFLVFTLLTLALLMVVLSRRILSSASTMEQNYDDSILLLKQYKSTVDRSFIVSKTDADGVITYVNDEFCKISGYSRDELIGRTHNLIRHPDMSKDVFADMWHTIKDLRRPWTGEIKNLSKDGTFHWVKAIINPILSPNGDVLEYIGLKTDITQQKEITNYFENELKLSVKNFNSSMHLTKEYEKAIDSSTILSRADKDGNIVYANDKFLEISEYTLDELVGKNHNILCSRDTADKVYKEVWSSIKDGLIWMGIIENISKSGKVFWTKTTIVPIKDLENKVIEYLIIRNDITEIMQQRKEFEKIANTDQLTGCGNRFRLQSDMKETDNLSVAIFNIDNFRQINDFYGQHFGDLIIQFIADRIYKIVSKDKRFKFYRLQGDEFITLVHDMSREELVDSVLKTLEVIKEKFILQNKEMLVSCSCGISFEDKEHLLSTANMALKIAKKSNHDYLVYDESISLSHEYKNNIYWTKKLSNAIKEDRIVPFYQPIVNNSNLAYEKYECLVRMIDKDKVISPFFFLEVAKQTKQYFEITKTVIAKSFEIFKDKNIEFSVNLSIMDIVEDDISEYIIMMLEKYDIGSRVVFEIVESEYIQNFQRALKFISDVKKYNCKIAIDDFGTGYSNFEYLIKLKADYLKIDGSLIKNIDKDENAYLVVSTIVEFSKKLGMKTIAEYVENENIFKIVNDLGIDYSQGYYFSEAKQDI